LLALNAQEAFLSALNDVFKPVSDLTKWKPLSQSQAWFSHFHGRQNFQLPFYPNQWLYSDIIMDPIRGEGTAAPNAYYKRGVTKYRKMIQRGDTLPPIIILYGNNRSGEGLSRADGNHRMAEAFAEELDFIPAVLGIKTELLKQ
jgi:hypothetical protein